jgi:MtrB/PioB family decaheme-associated outer membrane protein
LNGNFSLRGGDAYGAGNGTQRWSLTGTDLGLTSRSAGATVSEQGRWSFGINYDQLTHYTAGSYQTPYVGTMGGNIFTLPGFGAAAATTRTLSAVQLGQFHNMDINNNRDNTTLTGAFILSPQWNFKFDVNHLDQSGAKLNSFGSSTFGGSLGQKISLLPMPTNSRTETVNLAANWVGEKAHATIAYFASFYRDNINGVKFDTWSTATPVLQTYGTPPSNNFQQINLTGGYALSARTKLAGGLSYSYNTQDTAYVYDTGAVTAGLAPAPTASLNGAVATIHADLKLTDQTTKNLVLSAGFKYDDRDNRTSSNIYESRAINNNDIYHYPNTPLSVTKTQGEVAGDYRVDAKQKIRVALSYDVTDRECNQYAVGGGGGGAVVAVAPAYAPGTNCVTATSTRDSKLNATYRLRASDTVNLNFGYVFSARRTSFDENARPAMIGANGNLPLLTTTSGLNAGDYRGFRPFFEASRNQNLLKFGGSWQANDKLSFNAGARYTDDNYLSTYGVQKGTSWGVDLDASYMFREQGILTAYVTQQQRTRDLTDVQRSPYLAASATVPSGGTFSNDMKDTDTTVGLNIKQGGLMGGKFDIAGDLTYSLGQTDYYTQLNYNLLSGAPCSANTVLSCGSTPTIRNEMIQFKLTGTYQLEKNSKLSLGYLYRNLRSDDFYYNAYQYGYTPTGVLPTNQTSPSYAINMIFASFNYSFK